jgi:hypothetical protein
MFAITSAIFLGFSFSSLVSGRWRDMLESGLPGLMLGVLAIVAARRG